MNSNDGTPKPWGLRSRLTRGISNSTLGEEESTLGRSVLNNRGSALKLDVESRSTANELGGLKNLHILFPHLWSGGVSNSKLYERRQRASGINALLPLVFSIVKRYTPADMWPFLTCRDGSFICFMLIIDPRISQRAWRGANSRQREQPVQSSLGRKGHAVPEAEGEEQSLGSHSVVLKFCHIHSHGQVAQPHRKRRETGYPFGEGSNYLGIRTILPSGWVMVTLLSKAAWCFLKKRNIELSHDPATPLQGVCPRDWTQRLERTSVYQHSERRYSQQLKSGNHPSVKQ